MGFLASIVVEFGSGADSSALVVVELDDQLNLDEHGEAKTSFVPGDRPAFIIHYDQSVLRIGSVRSSSGMVVAQGAVIRTRQRRLSFTNTDDGQELPHIPSGPVAIDFYGNTPVIVQSGRLLTASGMVPAIGDAVYRIMARSYRLIPPHLDLEGEDEYPVLIVVTMEAST